MTTEEETTYITAAPVAPLRVCCYGSSSSRTPERYIDAAYTLGGTLAQRGHTCVNGAGSSGCMDAMNKGCDDAGGCIVGVIHEKFVKRGGDWFEGTSSVFRRDRGGVVVDEGGKVGGQTSGGGTGGGGKRNKNKNKHEHEIVIARGNDLQERKRLLVEGADALVVLPGGPGTWDEVRSYHNIESLYWRCLFCPPRPPFCIHFMHVIGAIYVESMMMMMAHPNTTPSHDSKPSPTPPPPSPRRPSKLWEMACARHIGFHSIPIVCINVDGYYDPFRAILSRAHDDMLLYKHPNDILHFEETPE
jgi:predicted Rossmann-fold nucleotide-binding protein